MADVSTFVDKTLSLLNIERKAEVDEARTLQESSNLNELQKKGVCLLKLRVRSRCTGLYGRDLLTFESSRFGTDGTLAAHRITPGDIVGVSYNSSAVKTQELCSGIVTRVTQTTVVVAFDDAADTDDLDDDGPYQLNRLANDVTYKRIKSAMQDLSKYRGGTASHLIDVLFGSSEVGLPLQSDRLDLSKNTEEGGGFFNTSLNESQKAAVRFALSQREIGVIHGPPGTGKTTTVVEIILQAVKKLGMKVLACAPSNVAVDNLVEKLAKSKAKVVRLGHPARLLKSIQQYSLDAILTSSDASAIIRDVRKDIDKALTSSRKSRGAAERKNLRQEIKTLRKELRHREKKAIKEILTGAEVVLATNTSAGSDGPLGGVMEDHFDLVVIDEAAQALEASCWIPLLRAPRCILSGDHHQLPPTIISHEAAKKGLDVTLMQRLVQLYGDKVVHMLTTQYRMNELIMQWSSDQLYEGRLEADSSVKHHLLKDLPEVKDTEDTSLPVLLIDTAGCDVYENEAEDEVSKGNDGEADIVTAHVTALVNAGLDPKDIAVIAPYNLQVELLRIRLIPSFPSLEIKSVDGFQGREKEAVVISLVRSNKTGVVGFLAEDRRINVAITRARRHLAVICDSETVSHHSFLKSLINYMNDNGEVRSAMQYLHENIITADVATLESSSMATHGGIRDTHPLVSKETKDGSDVENNTKKSENMKNPLESSSLKHNVKSSSKFNSKKSVLREKYCREEKLGIEKDLPDKSSEPSEKTKHTNNKVQHRIKNNFEKKKFAYEKRDVDDSSRLPLSKEQLEEQIQGFLKSKAKVLVFSNELTSQERFYVHSIAEDMCLEHESKGEGEDRHIVVRKIMKKVEIEKDDDLLSTCQICKKKLPTCNLTLHLLRCEQQEKQRTAAAMAKNEPFSETDDVVKKKKKAKKMEKNSQSFSKVKNDEEDLDEMLAKFTHADTRCAFESCKQCITMLGQTCRCCSNTYCLSHHIPEVHGCGDQAKVLSRKSLGKTEPRKPKKLDSTRKAQLQKKLDKKVNEMVDKRKHKKKE